jgi:thioredoxin
METTSEKFQEEVINASNEKPVVVDFYADWCGPCKMLGPIMEQLSEEMKDKAKIVKLNVQDSQEIASIYGVMSIPAVKMFKDGKVAAEFLGLRPKDDVKEWIESNL